jgi:hypothetical protein
MSFKPAWLEDLEEKIDSEARRWHAVWHSIEMLEPRFTLDIQQLRHD